MSKLPPGEGAPTGEDREQKMANLFAEYTSLREENNKLVEEWVDVGNQRLDIYVVGREKVLEHMAEKSQKSKTIEDRLEQIKTRQEEIYNEQVSLSGGEDLKALYQKWKQENS